MKYDSGKFEGGYRLAHINRTKKFLFVAQAIIVLVFAVYLLVAGDGFSMKPFFISVNSFLYFVLIMLLIISLEGFAFTLLEMRFMKSDSTKFIITQRAFRTSLLWVLVSLIVLLVFVSPLLPGVFENDLGGGGNLEASSSVQPEMATLFNSDALGLTEVDALNFEATGLTEVFIVTEESYDLFAKQGKDVLGGYRINDDYLIDPDLAVEFPTTAHGKFYILAYSVEDSPVTVDYTVTKRFSTSMMAYLPLLALMFLIAYSAWGAYMFIQNKRYVQGIYR
jgi:hypothetical protein